MPQTWRTEFIPEIDVPEVEIFLVQDVDLKKPNQSKYRYELGNQYLFMQSPGGSGQFIAKIISRLVDVRYEQTRRVLTGKSNLSKRIHIKI